MLSLPLLPPAPLLLRTTTTTIATATAPTSVVATASVVSGLSRRTLNVTICLNLLVLNSRIFMDLIVIENGAENGDPEIEQSLYLGKIPNMIIKRSC